MPEVLDINSFTPVLLPNMTTLLALASKSRHTCVRVRMRVCVCVCVCVNACMLELLSTQASTAGPAAPLRLTQASTTRPYPG